MFLECVIRVNHGHVICCVTFGSHGKCQGTWWLVRKGISGNLSACIWSFLGEHYKRQLHYHNFSCPVGRGFGKKFVRVNHGSSFSRLRPRSCSINLSLLGRATPVSLRRISTRSSNVILSSSRCLSILGLLSHLAERVMRVLGRFPGCQRPACSFWISWETNRCRYFGCWAVSAV